MAIDWSFLTAAIDIVQVGTALGILVGAIFLADLLIVAFDRLLRPLFARTKTTLDDRLFEALRGPFKLFVFLAGLWTAVQLLWPGTAVLGRAFDEWFTLLLIFAAGHLAASAVNAVILWYYQEMSEGSRRGPSKDVFPFARKIVKILIYFAILLIVLDRLGVEITPLLTGLGIAGLAVALAVKDSLANFFAGLYLLAEKPIRVGEFISVDSEDSKVQGFVQEIGWRSTRIRTRANVEYNLPNEKLTMSIIVNFSRGEGQWKRGVVEVGVNYDSDVALVEKLLLQAVDHVRKTDDRVVEAAKRAPLVRFAAFGDSALLFRLFFFVKNYTDVPELEHKVRLEVLRLFRKNGVNIPFPMRTLHVYDKGRGT